MGSFEYGRVRLSTTATKIIWRYFFDYYAFGGSQSWAAL